MPGRISFFLYLQLAYKFKDMKRILHIIIMAAAFSACSDSLPLNPAMSLFSDKPVVSDDTAIFRLAVINMPEGAERRFPVTFGGTAERGTDYEVSADAFVFGGENPIDSIVVTTLKFGTEKTVSMTVELPEDMESGKYLSSEFTLQDNPAYITFSQEHKILADSAFVRFALTDKSGKSKTLKTDTEISVLVDKTKSTAEEGVDFVFADSSHFTIPAGKDQGELKLKMLKPTSEEGRDRIVLTINYEEKFGQGRLQEMAFDLMDTSWAALDGKWAIDTLVTDTTYMMNFWGEKCSGYDLMPVYNERDGLGFDLDQNIFEPLFKSDFRNYFTGDCDFRKGPVQSLILTDGESAFLQTFLLTDTNRYFHKSEKSEDKESYIGIRIIEGLEENPDTLDLYVLDHTSKSFMPELEAEKKYAPEKPVAASPGQYINITFVK